MAGARRNTPALTTLVPPVALVVLVLSLVVGKNVVVLVLAGALLIGAVLSAVHHAEVVAHRVGEPFGSLVLAVSVTVIEVALIITLMLEGGSEAPTLARDTIIAAFMITTNFIVGICLFAAARRHGTAVFNAEGTGAALAAVTLMATFTLLLPKVTTSAEGPFFSPSQLAFAALASLLVYALFITTQTYRHRDFFLPVETEYTRAADEDHAEPPSRRAAGISFGLLLVALVAVVGLAKTISPVIEGGVEAAGLPGSFVGVVIALLVLAPESLAATNAARRDLVQTSLNLAYGSAIATIGLTVPAIALATVFIDVPLQLGLSSVQIVLVALTVAISVLTVVPGRATRLQGGLHLIVFAAFLFLSVQP